MPKRKPKVSYSLVGLAGDPTQFRVEVHHKGLWSHQPEIRIRREFNGKASRYGPSFPQSTLDDLIDQLLKAQAELKQSPEND